MSKGVCRYTLEQIRNGALMNLGMQTALSRRGLLLTAAGAGSLMLAGCAEGNSLFKVNPATYLQQHSVIFDAQRDLPNNALGAIGTYRVILTGEVHGISENYDIELQLIKYLNQHWDMRYLLCEMGMGESLYLDHYLQTGDAADLDDIMRQLKDTASGTSAYRAFLQKLFAYNRGLPEDRKVHAVGVDVDHQGVLWLRGVLLLLTSEVPEDAVVRSAHEALQQYGREDDYLSAYKLLSVEMDAAPAVFEALFVDASRQAKQVVKTLEQAFHYYSVLGSVYDEGYRDEVMADNFEFIVAEHPTEHFFGQFGAVHLYPREDNPAENGNTDASFAARLNGDSSFVRNRVCTVPLIYTTAKGIAQRSIPEALSPELFGAWWGNDVVFDLVALGSPFSKKVGFEKVDEATSALCGYQKLIFVANPTPAERD